MGWHKGVCPSSLEQLVLLAGTGLHGHVGVHLQNHIPVLIQEKDPEGVHLVGNAARLWDAWDDAHGSHDALDGGMVGRADDLQGRDRQAYSPHCTHQFPTAAGQWLRPLKAATQKTRRTPRAGCAFPVNAATAGAPGLSTAGTSTHGNSHLGALMCHTFLSWALAGAVQRAKAAGLPRRYIGLRSRGMMPG